jgi:hypothetical protein
MVNGLPSMIQNKGDYDVCISASCPQVLYSLDEKYTYNTIEFENITEHSMLQAHT